MTHEFVCDMQYLGFASPCRANAPEWRFVWLGMTEQFFSIKYAGRSDLFEGLSIWQEEKYRKIQGTYPVISLSFANIKEKDYETTRFKICQIIAELYADYVFVLECSNLDERERDFAQRVSAYMNDGDATLALHYLSKNLCRFYIWKKERYL